MKKDDEKYREWKEAVRSEPTFKRMVVDEGARLKKYKLWDRRRPELKVDPRPEFGNKLRATILCMVLAHSRGRLHCRTVWGRDARREELTSLDDQRGFILKNLSSRVAPTWERPFSEEEGEQIETFLNGVHVWEEEVRAA
jgi:hypothetical protein